MPRNTAMLHCIEMDEAKASGLSPFLRSCYDNFVTTICSVSYWRFISGFGPIGSSLGRPEQVGQNMQFAQRRINTGDCASG